MKEGIEKILLEVRRGLERQESAALGPYACPSTAAVRRRPDPQAATDHRMAFALDADRVLHSLAYTRYIDKTQVFSLVPNEHITHRVLHVQLVSKIGRSIARMLRLNEDLVEAIALAHDIGHPPFGHDGERFLDELSRAHGLGPFMHNIQSVRFLERIERGGAGLNLSLQVLDGVAAHDGEAHTVRLAPRREKDFAEFDREIAAKLAQPKAELVPMTLEGCVVRIADTIAYIGRDLEDAITLGLLRREEIPGEVARVLGTTNGTIVYRLVSDLVANSLEGDWVGFSAEVAEALGQLKRFNYRRIYTNPLIKSEHHKIRRIYAQLFEHFLSDLRAARRTSPIFTHFLERMSPAYREHTPPAMVVRDFIAGMTDEFFLRCYKDLVLPRRLPVRFDRQV